MCKPVTTKRPESSNAQSKSLILPLWELEIKAAFEFWSLV